MVVVSSDINHKSFFLQNIDSEYNFFFYFLIFGHRSYYTHSVLFSSLFPSLSGLGFTPASMYPESIQVFTLPGGPLEELTARSVEQSSLE